MTKKSYLSFIVCLALVVLMGAGCRGSDRRAEEPTPAFPFGEEAPVAGREDDSSGATSECANEYYPLHSGYAIEYRTQGGGPAYTSSLRVLEATRERVRVKNSVSRSGVAPLEIDMRYTCDNGTLVANGYVDAVSFTEAEGGVARGAEIETTSSEGQFMPARISAGQEWGAKYGIKITPLGRPDVLQEQMAVIPADVSIVRRAIGEEMITVPAGRFKAMKIASNTSFNGTLAHTGYEWWVKGKGMVKSVQGAGTGAITTEATAIHTSAR